MAPASLSIREVAARRAIRTFLIDNGRSPSVRDLQRALGYRSPRSAALLIEALIDKGLLSRRQDRSLELLTSPEVRMDSASTVRVPVVGSVPCGAPLLSEENIEGHVSVSTRLARGNQRYFLLRAIGDSMDRAGIQDGDLALVRCQSTAENGERVVALIDDQATVKKFHRVSSGIVLAPDSSNEEHQAILLTENFRVQGIVVASIPREDQELLWA